MSFYSALPLLTGNALTTDEWRNLVSAWRETPYVPNYAYRLSHLYRHAGQKEVASELVQRAFRMDHDRPDSVWLRAQERIRLGDFGGWREYQTRWSDPAFLAGHDYQRWFGNRVMWDGVEDLSGKSLLVVQEQGMGDAIQMLRYIPAARRACAKLYAFVHPLLYRVVNACYGDILEPWDLAQVRDVRQATLPGELLPTTDRHIGFMSLPGIFGPLKDGDRVMPWPLKEPGKDLGGIGLVWRGNPKNLNDHNRSMPREAFEKLAEALKPVTDPLPLYSFQMGYGRDWNVRTRPDSVAGLQEVLCYNLPPESGDWFDTAKSLRRIDRLVTIDSAVMHLAGSLGVETWSLNCYADDFRFPVSGDYDQWYDSVRLIRQEKPGDWDSCIAQLLARLSAERAGVSVQR